MPEIISFNAELAEKYGISEAILIQHFIHWITVNKRLDRNFHNGKTWTYMTQANISAYFGFWSKRRFLG